jgi:lysine 2,3-aminomutase
MPQPEKSSVTTWPDEIRRASCGLFEMLHQSETIQEARNRVYVYLNDRERELSGALNGAIHPLERSNARQCIRILKSIISVRNESIAGFSTLVHLWRFVRGEDMSEAGETIAEGFVLEFVHLFKGIEGNSGISRGWLGRAMDEAGATNVDFGRIDGRRAGVARSHYLDQLSNQVLAHVNRHPIGLDPEMIEKRQQNKQRIIDFFDATPQHWASYAWQLGHIFKGEHALPQLEQLIPMTDAEREAIQLCVEHNIPFGITPYYLSLFDFDSADRREDAQVRAQVIPPMYYVRRMIDHMQDREQAFDFMREHDTSPVDLVTRRYAGVAILKAFDTCPQICVYCQRNWSITGPMEPGALPCTDKLDAALEWFAERTNIREVLVTGGDPFFISDQRIGYIMKRLAAMEHITSIRWGTRSPVVMPMRITDQLAGILGRYVEPGRRTVTVVTHIQSAAEITPAVAEVVYRLRTHGLSVYNQQVFTLHTSRRFQTVANRVTMKKIGVDPYYTFYPKGKEETRDYRIPLARILQERKEEARLLPGTFRTDEPVFNVPRLGKNHIRAQQDRELVGIRPDGRRVYLWHPWEKGIVPVQPWRYVDASIHRYLSEIEKLGENPAQYASIWYYY